MIKRVKRSFTSYNGRHFLSRWVRNIFERDWIKKAFGLNLAAFSLFAAVIQPTVEAATPTQVIENVASPSAKIEAVTKTETTLSWPVVNPSITQGFHTGHPAIDIVNPADRNVHPVDKGWVSYVGFSLWEAYGNHILVEHPNGRKSLYAHLASISVKLGQTVERDTVLGVMGSTGHATGVHLHLEIYQDGQAINPLEVLPKL